MDISNIYLDKFVLFIYSFFWLRLRCLSIFPELCIHYSDLQFQSMGFIICQPLPLDLVDCKCIYTVVNHTVIHLQVN